MDKHPQDDDSLHSMDKLLLLQLWIFLYVLIADQVVGKETVVQQDGSTVAEAEQDPTVTASQLAKRLLTEHPNIINEKDALDIGELLATARNDPETIVLIQRLKYGSGQGHLEDLQKDQTPEEIVQGLQKVMSQLKLFEVIFDRDPPEAIAELEKEGLVPEEHLPEYRKNPQLLEQDMRKAYYFSFISLAVAGGFI